MSNRTTYPVEGNFRRPTIYAVSWAPNGSSAVSASTVKGNSRVSVARTGVGVFTITFNDKMPEMVFASARLLSDVNTPLAGRMLQVSSYNQATKSVTVTVVDSATGATPTDALTSASNTQICVMFIFRNSVAKH